MTKSKPLHSKRTKGASAFEGLRDGYCKGCWSVSDIKAPSGVAVMKRLSGFIITSAGTKWKCSNFLTFSAQRLKITLQIYSLNY